LADELEALVAKHRSGQQADLEQNLEPVADAEHEPPAFSEALHRLHHGAEPGDGSRPEVIPIGKSPWEDESIKSLDVGVLMPDILDWLFKYVLNHAVAIMIIIAAGKHHHAKSHRRYPLAINYI
jgi:hypothetical protein